MNAIINWRMNLYLILLLIAAWNSCSLETKNLYAAWCLEDDGKISTNRQVIKREVKLPEWYIRFQQLYFSFLRLKSLAKRINIQIILLMFLLIVGELCLALARCIICQNNPDKNIAESSFYNLAVWKWDTKIIRVAIGFSISEASEIQENAIYHSVSKNFMLPIQMDVMKDESFVAPVVLEETNTTKIYCSTIRYTESKPEKSFAKNAKKPYTKESQKKNKSIYPPSTEKQMKKFYHSLSEKDKRRYAGVEALKLGRGGIVYISNLLGCDRKTASKGIKNVKNFSARHVDQDRVRKRGGGRKPYHINHPYIKEQVYNVLETYTAGDPMREEVQWTNLVPMEICRLLAETHNVCISKTVASKILDDLGYGLRKLIKAQTMKEVAYRNQQFENITRIRASYMKSPNPIISMDNKKKEHLGNFYRNGRVYTREAIRCYDHDFPNFAEGVVIPHGIYDIKKNKGYMHLGTSHETSEFSCDCIKDWWLQHGKYDYPHAGSILILCDGGGSNSSRHYIFKQDIQQLVNEIGISIRLAHFPPYCSKYNPIEHKLFPHITRACQGVIFENINIVKSLMGNAKTRQGLEVDVQIVDNVYQLGRKATDEFRQNMGILFDESLPMLNYTVLPNGEVI